MSAVQVFKASAYLHTRLAADTISVLKIMPFAIGTAGPTIVCVKCRQHVGLEIAEAIKHPITSAVEIFCGGCGYQQAIQNPGIKRWPAGSFFRGVLGLPG
jgi:hypothetical protein